MSGSDMIHVRDYNNGSVDFLSFVSTLEALKDVNRVSGVRGAQPNRTQKGVILHGSARSCRMF